MADISRRAFLRHTATAATAAGFFPLLQACGNLITDKDYQLALANSNKIPRPASVNSGVTVTGSTLTADLTKDDCKGLQSNLGALYIPAASVLIINDNGTFRALGSTCPHAGCAVDGIIDQSLICPCHGSTFRFDGIVTQGPSAANLGVKTLTYDNVLKVITVNF